MQQNHILWQENRAVEEKVEKVLWGKRLLQKLTFSQPHDSEVGGCTPPMWEM